MQERRRTRTVLLAEDQETAQLREREIAIKVMYAELTQEIPIMSAFKQANPAADIDVFSLDPLLLLRSLEPPSIALPYFACSAKEGNPPPPSPPFLRRQDYRTGGGKEEGGKRTV